MAKKGEAKKTGSGDGLVRAVQTMYMECDARVKVGEKHSEWFTVDQDTRQGCSLSPWLFNVFVDTIVKEAKGLCGKSDIRDENVLLFADDMVLIADC